MRTAALVALLAALLPAGSASAGPCDLNLHTGDVDDPVHWADRHEVGRTRFAMQTSRRTVELVLTREVVAVQLSGRVMHKLDREISREREEDDGVIGTAIKTAILGSVRSLLDHSLECPLDELRDVRYRDGRLELITRDGERLFEDFEVDDEQVLESFPPAKARAFVREFRRLRAG